jgi:hypothetical protein
VGIVDERGHGGVLRVRREQVERRRTDREAILRGRRPERERALERSALRFGNPLELGERWTQGFFQIALGSVIDSPRIADAAQSGEGVGWHQHNHDVFDGCERFFRPGYNANLVTSWLPALGVVEKLERGATVADVGCGHGSSTILMAKAYPNSTFTGSDYHAGSIETARQRAREAGIDNVTFEVAPAAGFGGTLRLRHHVRLPARHGRPGGRCPPCP